MFKELFDLFFPRHCAFCMDNLQKTEVALCRNCLRCLPYRKDAYDQHLMRSLSTLFRLESAYSLLYFKEQTMTSKLIRELKYYNNPKVGIILGQLLAEKMPSPFDILLPIPLHSRKQKKRGYNQAEKIARGMNKILGIKTDTQNLVRKKNNPSQTHLKDYEDRVKNTLNIFQLKNPAFFENKHVLLIDDVVTTGSTIYNCANLFLPIKNTKISIACISFAG